MLRCCAAVQLIPYPSTYLRSPYNAYESVSATSCSSATVGCCNSNSLTTLVQDTSMTYDCYSTSDPGVNYMSMAVRPL